jgi:hypothetical protein
MKRVKVLTGTCETPRKPHSISWGIVYPTGTLSWLTVRNQSVPIQQPLFIEVLPSEKYHGEGCSVPRSLQFSNKYIKTTKSWVRWCTL